MVRLDKKRLGQTNLYTISVYEQVFLAMIFNYLNKTVRYSDYKCKQISLRFTTARSVFILSLLYVRLYHG